MRAPEKTTCAPSSTHTSAWAPSFSQNCLSSHGRPSVLVTRHAASRQATMGSQGHASQAAGGAPTACPHPHLRPLSVPQAGAAPRLSPSVPAPRTPTRPPHGPPCTARWAWGREGHRLTGGTHHQWCQRRGQRQQAFPRGLQGPFSGKMQELLETSGDRQLGCRLHTKGETSKGSHAGPTSVVGSGGLGGLSFPTGVCPTGAVSSKSSRPTTKHCRPQVAHRLLPTFILLFHI